MASGQSRRAPSFAKKREGWGTRLLFLAVQKWLGQFGLILQLKRFLLSQLN
jgi:hypothetical protein